MAEHSIVVVHEVCFVGMKTVAMCWQTWQSNLSIEYRKETLMKDSFLSVCVCVCVSLSHINRLQREK